MNKGYQNEKEVSLPTLYTAEQIAPKLKYMTADRVLELAKSGHMPCWWIDGKEEPLFRLPDVRRYLRDHMFREQKGLPMPDLLIVPTLAESYKPADAKVPTSLLHIMSHLRTVPISRPCGVYFLVKDDEVVYIGQSTGVTTRVTSHLRTNGYEGGKEFDRAYFIPVPQSELDKVEGAFIRALKPRLNGNPGPNTRRHDEEVLALFREEQSSA